MELGEGIPPVTLCWRSQVPMAGQSSRAPQRWAPAKNAKPFPFQGGKEGCLLAAAGEVGCELSGPLRDQQWVRGLHGSGWWAVCDTVPGGS